MVPNFGLAIFAVLALVLNAIIGLITYAMVGRCFLVVLEETACGNKEAKWPDEDIFDRLAKPFFLVYIAFFWTTVCWLVLLLAAPSWATQPLALAMVPGLTIWLLFPLSVFSALSAGNWYALLHGPFLRRVARRLGYLFLLYLLTAPLVGGSAGLVYLGLTRFFHLIFVVAIVVPIGLLLYARLLGQFGWLIAFRTPLKTPKKRAGKRAAKLPRAEAVDPWQVPTEETPEKGGLWPDLPPPDPNDEPEDEWTPSKKPYGLATEGDSEEGWKDRPKPAARQLESGYVVPSDAQPPARPPLEHYLRPDQMVPPPKPYAPHILFWSDVLPFLVYPQTLQMLVLMTVFLGAELFLVRTLMHLLGNI